MKRIFTLVFAAAVAQPSVANIEKAMKLAGEILNESIEIQEVNPHWIEYGNEPVLIQQNNNGGAQTLKFVSFQDGMLVAELEGGVGEISLPVSESMVRNLRLDNSKMPEIERMIRSGNLVFRWPCSVSH